MKSPTRTSFSLFLLASVLLLLLLASFSGCHGFVVARPSPLAAKTSTTRCWVNNDPYQDDYDRLEYAYRGDSYRSSGTDDYGYYSTTTTTSNDYDVETSSPEQNNRVMIDTANHLLRILHNSFRNVEGMANSLLQERPVVALTIFAAAGLLAAYVLGFWMLDGDMESWNPAENGNVPYWDEEIHVLYRRIH